MRELDDSSSQIIICLAVSLCAKAMALFLPGKSSAQARTLSMLHRSFATTVPGGSHACRHHLAEDPGSENVASVSDSCCWTFDFVEEAEARKEATDGDGALSQHKLATLLLE